MQGIGIAILGPSLLDLGEQVHAPLNQMSTVFTARSVGYLIGSLLAGWLLDKWNGYIVISLSCFVAVLSLIIVPLTHCLLALIITLICKGLALGALDTGECNVHAHKMNSCNGTAKTFTSLSTKSAII